MNALFVRRIGGRWYRIGVGFCDEMEGAPIIIGGGHYQLKSFPVEGRDEGAKKTLNLLLAGALGR